MTQPPSPQADLEAGRSLGNIQNAQTTLVLGSFSADGVILRRPQLSADLATAIRIKAQQWLTHNTDRSPVSHNAGYRPDETDLAYLTVAENQRAAWIKAGVFPPQDIGQLAGSGFLKEADFLAVVLASGDRACALLKRITASKVVLTSGRKLFALFGDNSVFSQVDSPILELDHSYHALLSNGHVFLASVEESERLLGLEAQLAAMQETHAQQISESLKVSDLAAFKAITAGNRIYRKKLRSAVERGLFKRPAAELAEFVAAEGLGLQFQQVGDQLVLVVQNSPTWLRDLMRLLDEDFVNGGISGDKYLSNSKRKR